jgi:hypothetical protein
MDHMGLTHAGWAILDAAVQMSPISTDILALGKEEADGSQLFTGLAVS